jgi:uncharacterized membrane protein YfcA
VSAVVWVLLAVASLLTATVSGVLGMAGGIALLGVMAVVLPAPAVVPIHGVVQLGSNLSRTLVLLKKVHWPIFAWYAPALGAGVAVAALVWQGDLAWFRPAIGVFILVFLVVRRKQPKLRKLPLWLYAPVGLVTGFLTLFIGATGPFIAPFFFRDDLDKEQIIATKAICQTVGHLLKLPAFLAIGFDYIPYLPLLGVLLLCTIAGTLVGRQVLERISERTFGIVFEVVLGGIALLLIFRPSLV